VDKPRELPDELLGGMPAAGGAAADSAKFESTTSGVNVSPFASWYPAFFTVSRRILGWYPPLAKAVSTAFWSRFLNRTGRW
jgi:hypothetical protein